MSKVIKILTFFGVALGAWLVAHAQLSQSPSGGPPSTPPKLPTRIPPPPSFAMSSSDTGKFQIVSAEYYSQDAKPFLYKRLVKVDTETGEAWVLHSARGERGEVRKWLPMTDQ